jgi:hypothetical protein
MLKSVFSQVYVFLESKIIDPAYLCINEVFIGEVTRVIFFSLGHVSGLEHLSTFQIMDLWSTGHNDRGIGL